MIADKKSRGMFKYTKVFPFFVSGPLGTAAVMESVSCASDEIILMRFNQKRHHEADLQRKEVDHVCSHFYADT